MCSSRSERLFFKHFTGIDLMINNMIVSMMRIFKDDVRRVNHALKVYGFAHAISISENITGPKKDIIEMAAVLHDIGIKEAERKYGSAAGNYQEIEGPPIARDILEALGIPAEIIDRVCFIIGNHHSYQKIDDIDFQILVEADFLVNMHEDEMKRNSIESVLKKYFRTGAGKVMATSLYLNPDDQ